MDSLSLFFRTIWFLKKNLRKILKYVYFPGSLMKLVVTLDERPAYTGLITRKHEQATSV